MADRAEYWVNGTGQNMLKGVSGDKNNPIMLDDETIVYILLRVPNARASFDRLVPTLLPAEQTRLLRLRETSASMWVQDPIVVSDGFQKVFNTKGVRRGGAWAPPPFRG